MNVTAGAIVVDTTELVDMRSVVSVIVLAGAVLIRVFVILSVDAGCMDKTVVPSCVVVKVTAGAMLVVTTKLVETRSVV